MISTELSVAMIVLFFFFNLLWNPWVCWEAAGLKLQEKGHSSHISCPNESIKSVCTANLYRLEKLFTCLSKPNAGGSASACSNPAFWELQPVPALLSRQVGWIVLFHYNVNRAEPTQTEWMCNHGIMGQQLSIHPDWWTGSIITVTPDVQGQRIFLTLWQGNHFSKHSGCFSAFTWAGEGVLRHAWDTQEEKLPVPLASSAPPCCLLALAHSNPMSVICNSQWNYSWESSDRPKPGVTFCSFPPCTLNLLWGKVSPYFWATLFGCLSSYCDGALLVVWRQWKMRDKRFRIGEEEFVRVYFFLPLPLKQKHLLRATNSWVQQ